MRAPKPETPYMETEALLAVMNSDDERLKQILDDLHPGETRELYKQVSTLSNELWTRMQDNAMNAYRPRHQRRSTVPESASFNELETRVHHRDTGSWEPGERDW